VPAGSVFAFLAEHRQELFSDSFIADLFSSSTGRPSLPADLIGSVLVLKELYDLSDPQTAEALRYDSPPMSTSCPSQWPLFCILICQRPIP
jgi:hypothetical protein